jgi:hypothetical protein
MTYRSETRDTNNVVRERVNNCKNNCCSYMAEALLSNIYNKLQYHSYYCTALYSSPWTFEAHPRAMEAQPGTVEAQIGDVNAHYVALMLTREPLRLTPEPWRLTL